MKRLSLLVLLIVPALALALDPTNDPTKAVIRIKSHGASATIIATTSGKSIILGCCHMFFHQKQDTVDPNLLRKRLVFDGPTQPHAPQQVANARVLLYDAQLDLSLLELDNGPFNYVPVAPQGHQPSQNIGSYGYDEMKWPITARRATITATQGNTTYTLEKPWHGRSGGGLIDMQAKALIGVVQGYEVGHQNRGMYVSHQTILGFLARYNTGRPQPSPGLSSPLPPHFGGSPFQSPFVRPPFNCPLPGT